MAALTDITPEAAFVADLPRVPFVFRTNFGFFGQFASLLQHLNRQDTGDNLTGIGLLLSLFGTCQRHADAQHTGRQVDGASVFITAATVFMCNHLSDALSVADLAQHCHMSPSSFAHRFKAETGLTPKRWLARERMRVARRLRLEGRTVSETSAELGFATPFHFSRVFSQSEGVAPSHFQRLSRLQG